jgi:hypothetical protein
VEKLKVATVERPLVAEERIMEPGTTGRDKFFQTLA